VQLLDRAAFPRNKPCGGAISLRALRRFPYLDEALVRMPTRRLSRLYLESPSGQGHHAHVARRGAWTPRVLLRSPGLAVRLFLDAPRRCVDPDGIPGRRLTCGPDVAPGLQSRHHLGIPASAIMTPAS
jgi:hypothetical protein